MANTAYICRVRTDIPAGVLQITDLHPNTSQASAIYQPNPMSGYVPLRVENETLTALSTNKTTAAFKGLAAYLISNCIETTTGGGASLTITMANDSADALIALADAGSALTETAVNSAITTAAAKTVDAFDASTGSSGVLTEILKILAGGKFTLPAGSEVGGKNTASGAADLGSFNDNSYRQQYVTGSLQISCGEGVISSLASSSFSYLVDGSAVTGRAVSVYDSQGNNLA